ncbi:MAG TPA: M2 family metallopeptidase [Gemmatimonadota bacterium]|nr:M2 family metallopeptidase [Gemmatimonadota bacterium]
MNERIERFLRELQPLSIEGNRAWWDAAVTGRESDYRRLEESRNRIDRLYRDPGLFEELRAARATASEPLAARRAELLYLEALPRQVDPALSERINRLSTGIERDFSTYRPIVGGRRHTFNDLEIALATERDPAALEAAWEGLKSVGPVVAGRLDELVRLRNEAARAAGYPDYYHLKLGLGEQDAARVDGFFDRLDALTDAPFTELKSEIDARLAEIHGIDETELRPWHYQNSFFQEMPAVYGVDLDEVYREQDPLEVARRFFSGIGLEVGPILARSSLYEQEGKDQHAFATDIDREGDVRILLNLRPNERWMGTTLHELGHAVYDEGIARDLPWDLRRPAHTLTTEAIAMLFGRLSREGSWMAEMGILDRARAEELQAAAARQQRGQMLAFSRWAMVMRAFEKELYRDPNQDLNGVWWSLVERLQGLAAPPRPADAADYAAKIHVVSAPVYYHNYMLGECFASQIDERLKAEVLDGRPTYCGEPGVGAWLSERIFRSGALHHYDELARSATGAAVGPEAFAAQFLTPVAG